MFTQPWTKFELFLVFSDMPAPGIVIDEEQFVDMTIGLSAQARRRHEL